MGTLYENKCPVLSLYKLHVRVRKSDCSNCNKAITLLGAARERLVERDKGKFTDFNDILGGMS